MSDLISREALLELFQRYARDCATARDFSAANAWYGAADVVEVAPAVEESSPCEGEWQNTGKLEEWYSYMYKCSKCGNETLDSGKFCSNCGAKMKEVEEGQEDE